ncbi:putative small secreted protein [Botrytis cinerea BcDW1]|uniref:NADH dehydrogenase [ubiquinone] 1 alpha subcomplex subunit 1 n=1 Tax=Botryotinia fuckeliana (strain BcDW1) TaxID=1290391 RepID=M7UAE8_BOTF1|nr:putative small secreted protein [Botrytis cinerea BcDW1]
MRSLPDNCWMDCCNLDNYEIATMGVPFEALLPYGIMLAMFGITGAGMSGVRALQNGGKRARHSVDAWDRQSNLYPRDSTLLCMILTAM